MKFFTYRILNTVTGKAYFGSTIRPEKRWARHQTDLRCGVHHCVDMVKDFEIHGIYSFEFKVLDSFADKASARHHETELMQADNAYNQTRTSMSSWGRDEETRKKHREAIAAALGTPEKRESARIRAKQHFSNPEARERTRQKQLEFIQRNPERAKEIASAGGKISGRISREAKAKAVVRSDGLYFAAVIDAARHMRPDDVEKARSCIRQALKRGNASMGFFWRYG